MSRHQPKIRPGARKNEPDAVHASRLCLLTGRPLHADESLRFVVAPDGTLVVDIGGSLPGAPLFLEARAGRVRVAVSQRAFDKSAGRALVIPDDFVAMVGARLRAHALGALGLARRAGALVCGFERVRAALKEKALNAPKAMARITAIDAAPDARARAARLAEALGVPGIDVFTQAELGAALGRGSVVHAALLRTHGAAQALRAAERVLFYGGRA